MSDPKVREIELRNTGFQDDRVACSVCGAYGHHYLVNDKECPNALAAQDDLVERLRIVTKSLGNPGVTQWDCALFDEAVDRIEQQLEERSASWENSTARCYKRKQQLKARIEQLEAENAELVSETVELTKALNSPDLELNKLIAAKDAEIARLKHGWNEQTKEDAVEIARLHILIDKTDGAHHSATLEIARLREVLNNISAQCAEYTSDEIERDWVSREARAALDGGK